MIYFSEIRGKPVITEDGLQIGVLDDFIFLLAETPRVTKLIIQNKTKNRLIIPIDYLIKINLNIRINKNYLTSDLDANELYLVKNILDNQIIDLKGNKVVRVNDVVIQDKPEYYIAGVDVGILGILRWLKIEKMVNNFLALFQIKPSSQFLSWADIQPLELVRGEVRLKKTEDKLRKIRPEDLADYLEKTNIINIDKILKILDEKTAARVLANLNLSYQAALFRNFSPDKTVRLLSLIDPDEALDILLTLSDKKQKEIISLLDEKKRKEIERLLDLSSTPIGSVMTTEFLTVPASFTVRGVIDLIKKETGDFYYFNVVYVVDNQSKLVGVFSLHNMLLQSLDTPAYKFMITNVISVHLKTPEEIALKKILKYNLYSLPVINESKHIVGVVTLGDLIKK